jgi:hypothetical protein
MSFEGLFTPLLNRAFRPSRPQLPTEGLRLGTTRQQGMTQAVHLANRRRTEHVAILGKSGSGKTNLLLTLADQHFVRGEGFIFFDFHGDATNHLMRLAAQHPEAAEHLVLVDLSDPATSPGINPLEPLTGDDDLAGHTSELAAILRQRWHVDSFGARTEELLRNTLLTLAAGGHTIVQIPLLLSSPDFRASLVNTLTNPEVKEYWTTRYEPLSEPMKAVFREPLLNKVTEFITERACRHFLGQPHSTIQLSDAIERGDWILVCLPKGQLRHHALTIGNLICAHLLYAILARIRLPEGTRRIFTIFCDEVQNLAENASTLITLFAEGRKFGTSLITANQFWQQLPSELRGAVLSAGTIALFRISAADAATLSPELTGGRRRLSIPPSDLALGHAWVRIADAEPLHVAVPRVASPVATSISAFREHILRKHSRPRREIERAIATIRQAPAQSEAASGETETGGQHGW